MFFHIIAATLINPSQLPSPAQRELVRIFGPAKLVRREKLEVFKNAAKLDTLKCYRIFDTGHPEVVVVVSGIWCDHHGCFHFPPRS
jgi:hypothetical protein